MFKTITKTECFKRLSMETNALSHAYLFYSKDKILNENMAELFAMKVFCENNGPCFECDACKKMLLNKNPDFIVLDKPSILVDDVSKILEDAELKPMIFDYKIILIKNAEVINEIAQNKLLKTLEEPNRSTIFIMTTTNEDKLLATLKSRVKKHYLSIGDLDKIKDELVMSGVNTKYITEEFSITEMVDNSNNSDYLGYIENIEKLFLQLKSTQDIPKVVSNLKLSGQNKFVYIELVSKLFNSLKTQKSIYSSSLIASMLKEYPLHLIVKIDELIDDAYRKLKSNVNANYVFDCLLYSILKEKYLCKQ